ncbi:ras-specific guanine nucleotide-releasing factor RalGPS2-like [Actinia tenebrosa]|uniref:Ras-specific guanine nucleotide-releasing factor RalGPS2-like n=1 Tax=Actinia tenebrosa TaxID=6105 RepID=A0A6P8HTE9_ACTTE|nr:ras-specific guanine nucleotide-releasing factor RalGPS2-like [Actinia tenebrosa]XP_031558508.1 ras-specific guanine nucleotide-releasing factor RalGPS2-like [Actinia tenebrosa]
MTEKKAKRISQHQLLDFEPQSEVNEVEDEFSSSSDESPEVSEDELDACSNKNFDAVVFDIRKVTPEEFAKEVTYKDIYVFKSIRPEELSGCGWTKKDKLKLAPNVVAFIQRFNHISFWVVREILNAKKLKTRVAVMSHFIRIAKKFLELNNIHALKAVISGLESVPVYRLDMTWEHLPKRDHATFEKLVELLSEDENRKKLREYLSTVKLPCIPHLGMYLTDIMYIDTIHPSTGGLDNERTRKMNDIIRIISEFQQSNYGDIESQPYIQEYLNSMNYIEELQKFLEDNNYRLSLEIEPTESDNKSKARSRESIDALPCNTLNPPVSKKFVPGHRKTQSLDTNLLRTPLGTSFDSLSIASSTSSRHLIDDSIVPLENQGSEILLNGRNSALSLERASGVYERDDSELFGPHSEFQVEGFLRRKKCLRNNKKLAVSTWQKFWVGLSGKFLYYFLPKHRSVGKLERSSFKSNAQKVINIENWIVHIQSDSHHTDCFQLTDPFNGNSYKFRTGSQSSALMWYTCLSHVTTSKNKTPQNLISFEESEEVNDTKM